MGGEIENDGREKKNSFQFPKQIMKDSESTTVISWKIILCLAMCLVVLISMTLLFNKQALSSPITLTTSVSEDYSNVSSKIMKKFMRSLYNELHTPSRRSKRQLNLPDSSLILSDNIDSIVSLFNQHTESNDYHFDYQSSLENLTHIELVLPIQRLTKSSKIEIQFAQVNLLFEQPFQIEKNFIKINLTIYIRQFPIQFSMKFHGISLRSSGFLTLYFHRLLSASHSRIRRDSSSLNDDHPLITNPADPSSCQVRPFRPTVAELNWTSWIIEPSSFDMNICSGICHTDSHMPSYFTMQNILHEISPKKIPTLCCKPKRFSSTILLFYDGANLILKRYDNMRVVECGCS